MQDFATRQRFISLYHTLLLPYTMSDIAHVKSLLGVHPDFPKKVSCSITLSLLTSRAICSASLCPSLTDFPNTRCCLLTTVQQVRLGG